MTMLPGALPGSAGVPGQRTGARRPLPRRPAVPGPRLSPRCLATAGALGPWLLAAAFAVLYLLDSGRRYAEGATVSWDLGLFTEAVKQYAHLHAPIVDARAPGFDLLGEHFHPIVALLAPLFVVAPTPVTLLAAQAVLIALSIPPVISIARERLGTRQGHIVGAAYGTSFGLVEAVDFDFHEYAFAVPLIALALSALLRDRTRPLMLACLGLLCTKEEFGITVVLPIGIAWTLRDRTRWRRRVPLAAAGLAASLLQIRILIPKLNPDHVYGFLTSAHASGSAGDVEGFGQLLAGGGAKLYLLFLLCIATAFTALFSPLALLAVPDLLMRFASSNPHYWGTFYHYNAVLMPILFIAAVDGIARARARNGVVSRFAGRLGVAGIGVAALGILPGSALVHAFSPLPYAFGPLHLAALHRAVDEVPAGASVEASLDALAPLAAKADTYWIGNIAIDPAPTYVVFDGPAAGVRETPDQMLALARAWHPSSVYTVLSVDDGVYVLQRI